MYKWGLRSPETLLTPLLNLHFCCQSWWHLAFGEHKSRCKCGWSLKSNVHIQLQAVHPESLHHAYVNIDQHFHWHDSMKFKNLIYGQKHTWMWPLSSHPTSGTSVPETRPNPVTHFSSLGWWLDLLPCSLGPSWCSCPCGSSLVTHRNTGVTTGGWAQTGQRRNSGLGDVDTIGVWSL